MRFVQVDRLAFFEASFCIMPPKQSASAKKRAASAVAVADKVAKKEKATSCLAKLEVEVAKPAAKRHRSRNFEDSISKALRDNFPTWVDIEFDMTFRNGLSLRSTLARDKEKGDVMGKHYYAMLREEFSTDDSPDKAMILKDPSQPGDTAMEKAMAQRFLHNRSFVAMTEWLETVPSVNQKVLRAVYKGLLKIPLRTFENASLLLACLKMTKRLRLHETEKDTWKHMIGTFDSALCRSVAHCRSHEQSVATWWKCFGSFADLILPAAAVDKCIACDTKFDDVKDELQQIVNSSNVGMKLFYRACEQLVSTNMDRLVDISVKRLDGKNLTAALLAKEREMRLWL